MNERNATCGGPASDAAGCFGVDAEGELPFVFRNGFGQQLSDADTAMSDVIDGYWFRFARTGDPNGDGAVAWPAYAQASDTNLVLDTTVTTNSGLKKDKCDFWDTLE